MTTPNNAAALERLENELREELRNSQYVVELSVEAVSRWADELATLRAALAQPDALTSQPSGEVVAWRVANHPSGPFALRKTMPSGWAVIEPLYTHPSADAPGVAVDEWRPIETAPKEAPYWVVWSAYYQRPVVVTQRSSDNTYWEGDWGFDVQATHWTAALAPKPEGGHG